MIINRFIYVYKEHATGKPVYVGSAFDVPTRDKQHTKGSGCPFDDEIARRGRDAFTLHVVDNVVGETVVEALTRCVERENDWMDECGTYRTERCFNFSRANVQYNSQEHWEARNAAVSAALKKFHENPEARACHLAVHGTPEVRARISAAQKKRYENPEERTRQSAALKITRNTPEARARNSARMKKHYENPEARARQSAACSTSKASALHSAALKKRYENPEARARTSAEQKKRYENPEARARTSAAMKKHYENPEARAHKSAAMKKSHYERNIAAQELLYLFSVSAGWNPSPFPDIVRQIS